MQQAGRNVFRSINKMTLLFRKENVVKEKEVF